MPHDAHDPNHPHGGGPVVRAGTDLADADAAMLLLHGRGAPADDLVPLAQAITQAVDARVAFVAPQATSGQWYPQRFTEPRAANEPWLGSALARAGELLDEIEGAGIPKERTVLLGFSQGACLALDVAAGRGERLGGVIALSGGLIGHELDEGLYARDLGGTPFFLGCGDPDPHIPRGRVEASGELLARLGGAVDVRMYPGLGHRVDEDEVEAGRALVRAAFAP